MIYLDSHSFIGTWSQIIGSISLAPVLMAFAAHVPFTWEAVLAAIGAVALVVNAGVGVSREIRSWGDRIEARRKAKK